MAHVSKTQIHNARFTNLYDFLISQHRDSIKVEGDSVRLLNNHSVSVKRNYFGYMDFATGEKGNSIDFLIKYFGYTFVEAVESLCKRSKPISQQNTHREMKYANMRLSERFRGKYKNLFAYLTKTRKIPAEVVQKLLDEDLIYQESEHNNIVFVNNQRTFAEVHGTSSYGKSFHGIIKNSDTLAFWWFKSYHIDSEVRKAFICESAIDAISLHCLKQARGDMSNYLYCSIAGANNQQKIDLLKSCEDVEVVIAVDNDSAGERCRQRNSDCESIVPRLKDWNEDWCQYCNQFRG